MKCFMCDDEVTEVKHIAIDAGGDPHVLCDDCYEKARIFFEEVKRNGKADS